MMIYRGRARRRLAAVVSCLLLLFTSVGPVGAASPARASAGQSRPGQQDVNWTAWAQRLVERHAAPPKVERRLLEKLKSSASDELIPVIVTMKRKADPRVLRWRPAPKRGGFAAQDFETHRGRAVSTLKNLAEVSQGPVRAALRKYEASGRARDVRSFWIFNGLTARLAKAAIYELANLPDVEQIRLNDVKFKVAAVGSPSARSVAGGPRPVVSGNGSPTGANQSSTWGIQRIGADQVWAAGYDGTGVVVGHLDTGIDPRHPDLLVNPAGDPNDPANWKLVGWAEFDWSGNMVSNNLLDAYDDDGHGTHTAGTIAGGAASGTHIGVAPGARIISGKVLTYGGGTFEQVVAGMQWIITQPGVRVVGMSLGAEGVWPEMIEPTRNMVAMGIFPSFAIGNCGPDCTGSPGNVPAAYGVGATDEFDADAWFSSGGMVSWNADPYHGQYLKPDISAPGVNVLSSLPPSWCGGSSPCYGSWMGTSMATPHVSGAVALILQAYPWLSVDELKSLLRGSAADLGAPGPDTRFGWGRLDVLAALNLMSTAAVVNGYVTGPDGEPVEAELTVDGATYGRADPVTGAYDLVLSPGTHSLSAGHPFYETQTVSLTLSPGDLVEQNFVLQRKALGTFKGTVKTGAGQPVANAVVEIEELRGYPGYAVATDSQGKYQINNVPSGSYTLRVISPLPYQSLQQTAAIPSGGGTVTVNFTVTRAGVWLIDHDYGDTWENFYMQALSSLGIAFAYWDYDAEGFLPPWTLIPQTQRVKVILATFDGWPIWADELAGVPSPVRTLMDRGHALFVSGQDLGYLVNGLGPFCPGCQDFYRNYLHAQYVADSSGSWLINGLPKDGWPQGVFDGTSLDINLGGDGANNQWYPDVVAPADSQATSVAEYAYAGTPGSAALAVDGPAHRAMYFSFGFEGINGATTREQVMQKVLGFLDQPTENSSSQISYSSSWSVGSDPSATESVYRQWAVTGATASFAFEGDNVTLLTARGPAYGKASLFIDAVYKGTVDLYNATQTWGVAIYRGGLSAGPHTLTVKVLGTKNSSSGGYDVVVDGFRVKHDDTEPAVSYTGTWITYTGTPGYKGTATGSVYSGDSAAVSFSGRGIMLRMVKGPSQGIARVYLDGMYKGTVDLYKPSWQYDVLVKTFSSLSAGPHTLRVVVSGQKNAASSGYEVRLDSFQVTAGDGDATVTYSSAWQRVAWSCATWGDRHRTFAAGARATYGFAGNSITWLTSKGPGMGIARVYVDGNDMGTVDLYNPTNVCKASITFSGLAPGPHTVTVENTGTMNPAATGTQVVVDGFRRGLNE